MSSKENTAKDQNITNQMDIMLPQFTAVRKIRLVTEVDWKLD